MLNALDIDNIRDRFQKYAGAIAFHELTQPKRIDPLALIGINKAAHADRKLLGVALDLAPGDPFTMYERLGGTYSHNRK